MVVEDPEVPEDMATFFDIRADGYDDVIRNYVFEGVADSFYEALCEPIERTDKPLQILDLGCGTGLEIAYLLQRVPNAVITGVDLSTGMLEHLQGSYIAHMGQITLITDSYLTMPLGTQAYNHVISALANHHLLRDAKRQLYTRIHAALKPGGKYIEGDSVTRADSEGEFLADFQQEAAKVPPATDGYYHIDIPFSIETQRSLLLEAGFRDFELLWQLDSSAVWNIAVYAVTA